MPTNHHKSRSRRPRHSGRAWPGACSPCRSTQSEQGNRGRKERSDNNRVLLACDPQTFHTGIKDQQSRDTVPTGKGTLLHALPCLRTQHKLNSRARKGGGDQSQKRYANKIVNHHKQKKKKYLVGDLPSALRGFDPRSSVRHLSWYGKGKSVVLWWPSSKKEG